MLIVLVGLSWRFRNLAKVEIVELWPNTFRLINKPKEKKGERHHDEEAS